MVNCLYCLLQIMLKMGIGKSRAFLIKGESHYNHAWLLRNRIKSRPSLSPGEGALVTHAQGGALSTHTKGGLPGSPHRCVQPQLQAYQSSGLHSKSETCFTIMLINVYFGFKKLGDKYNLGLIPYNKHTISRV